MKSIFPLALGTIVLLLATTAQDSPIARIILASVGLALCAVALSPRASRSESKGSWHLKPGKPKLGEFSVQSHVSESGQVLTTQSISPPRTRPNSPTRR